MFEGRDIRWLLRKAALGLGIGLLGGALLVGSLPFLLAPRTGTQPPPSDVIVFLDGRSERALYARDLVNRGLAPRLVSTIIDPGCVRAGKPLKACLSGVRNTVDEAVFVRRVLPGEGVRQATIVTSAYHVPRASTIFRIVFIGSGIGVRVVGVPGGPPAGAVRIRELLKFFPSVGAAILGRLSPSLYERVTRMLGGRRQ